MGEESKTGSSNPSSPRLQMGRFGRSHPRIPAEEAQEPAPCRSQGLLCSVSSLRVHAVVQNHLQLGAWAGANFTGCYLLIGLLHLHCRGRKGRPSGSWEGSPIYIAVWSGALLRETALPWCTGRPPPPDRHQTHGPRPVRETWAISRAAAWYRRPTAGGC
jgi:hypothetical protein